MVDRKGLSVALAAAAAAAGAQDLGSMRIEELMNLKVTTASRRAQDFEKTPAAIFVLTKDDIRRSGATTIPEMLRLVPGLQVGVIDGSKFQVGIRGFAGHFSNKLQVLIDGRSIYTLLYSSVTWELNLVDPDEIERIEIVRGPGGAAWGANAVNGVINIITQSAEDSHDSGFSAGTGDPENLELKGQLGGDLGDAGYYRMYARVLNCSSLSLPGGASAGDGWRALHGAARLDWTSGDNDTFAVSARFQTAKFDQVALFPTLAPPYVKAEESSPSSNSIGLAASWDHAFGEGDSMGAKFTYSGYSGLLSGSEFRTSTLDFGLDRSKAWKNGTSFVAGANYRRYWDDVQRTNYVDVRPSRSDLDFIRLYLDGEVKLSESLLASAGASLERNPYTGWEFQPSARLSWSRNSRETYWLSAAKAVRTPSRTDIDFTANLRTQELPTGPLEINVVGSQDVKSEEHYSLQAGARIHASKRLFLDLTAYYSSYRSLLTYELGSPYMDADPVPHASVDARATNNLKAWTGGFEAAATYNASDHWRLLATMTFFTDHFSVHGGNGDLVGSKGFGREGSTPRIQATFRSSHQLRDDMDLDLTGFYASETPAYGIAPNFRMDARLGWHVSPREELSLAVRNLFGGSRIESGASVYEQISEVGRSVSLRYTMRF